MPSLQGAMSRFTSKFLKASGQIIRGYPREPQSVRASFDGLFSPRFMLAISPDQNLVPGEVIMDEQGNYFLCGKWSPSMNSGEVVANVFVMFSCNANLQWQRSPSTIEPISGLKRAGLPEFIMTLRGLKEPVARVKDGMDVEITKYRVLVGQPVSLDDLLGGGRVQRVEPQNGLFYCETT